MLPFKVVPTRQRADAKPTLAAYKKAITSEVAATLLGPKAEELRFPRLEDAEAAKRRLEKALPASQWTIVQEVAFEPLPGARLYRRSEGLMPGFRSLAPTGPGS